MKAPCEEVARSLRTWDVDVREDKVESAKTRRYRGFGFTGVFDFGSRFCSISEVLLCVCWVHGSMK